MCEERSASLQGKCGVRSSWGHRQGIVFCLACLLGKSLAVLLWSTLPFIRVQLLGDQSKCSAHP